VANFTARITSAHSIVTWVDPSLSLKPTRLNAAVGQPHRYIKLLRNVPCVVKCTVNGSLSEGPLDTALGGKLFQCWFAEYPNLTPLYPWSPGGQSSVVNFTPIELGSYLLVISRDGGGAIAIHLQVEPV
jgi:hypothetical protein